MFRVPSTALLFILATTAADEKRLPRVADLAWLSANWGASIDGVETEENWTSAKGGLLLGTHRVVRPQGKTFFEFLRIADTETGFSYFASPGGKLPTEFKLKSLEKEKVTFENLDNDFPQRILYALKDGKLHARIEGTINGKERSPEWIWAKK